MSKGTSQGKACWHTLTGWLTCLAMAMSLALALAPIPQGSADWAHLMPVCKANADPVPGQTDNSDHALSPFCCLACPILDTGFLPEVPFIGHLGRLHDLARLHIPRAVLPPALLSPGSVGARAPPL